MPLQTVFTSGRQEDGSLDQSAFFVIVLAIIWGWLLVSIFQRLIENFAFQTLGMNSRSTLHALIISIIGIITFVAFVFMIDAYQIIPASAASETLAEATAGLAGVDADDTASNTVTEQLGNNRRGHPIVIGKVNYF